MSAQRDRDRLLSDILAEPVGFGELRDALLDRTLRQVKRRRIVRRVQRAGSVLLLLPALALLLWWGHWVRRPEAATRVPYVLVRTTPLPRASLVVTQPFAPSGLVASAASRDAAAVTTRPGEREYREIDDATLLALAGSNAAVLVRSGPHSAELVFASETTAVQSPQ